jgi:DNA-binding MarR family transcriptional regulator
VPATETSLDPALAELANAVGTRIGRLARVLIRETIEVSRTTLSVLATLRERPRRITELASLEHVAQPTMTVLVSRLEQRGWVERQPDPTDRRAVQVAITDAGTKVLDELIAKRTTLLAERLGELSETERETLARAIPILDRLIDGSSRVTGR